MNKQDYKRAIDYFSNIVGLNVFENPEKDRPYMVELELYTDAGGDMIFSLEEPSKEKLQEYIDNFDINEEVVIWWPNGQRGMGVPFDNVADHYYDLRKYLNYLQKICDDMPI